MKKGFFTLFILIIFLIPCFCFLQQNSFSSAQNSSAFDVHQQLAEVSKNDDYSYIRIEKNSSFASINQTLSFKNEIQFLNNENIEPTHEEFMTLCKENDYVIEEEEDCYKVRNKFALKRLVVGDQVNKTYGASKVITGLEGIKVLCYDSIEETKLAYEKFKSNNINVDVDFVVTTAENEVEELSTVEDPFDYSQFYTWGAEAMQEGLYYSYYTNNNAAKDVVVAVLDSGINTTHSWFTSRNRILQNEVGNLVGYSYVETTYDYSGISFEDDQGHGTHVSGIISELTPSCVKILPIRVLGKDGGSFVNISAALDLVLTYAETYNIVCVNMSIGSKDESTESVAESQLEKYFNSRLTKLKENNILSCIAAGNSSTDAKYYYPSNAGDNAIVVSALKSSDDDSGNKIYSFDSNYSNYGASVDMGAPGTDIISAYINPENATSADMSGFWGAKLRGTSMATPHVSAAVALLYLDNAYYTGKAVFSAEAIEKRLYLSAVDLGDEGKDIYYGHGMLNLANHIHYPTFDVQNTIAQYDGEYHNIEVNVTNPVDATIKYGFTEGEYNITDITTNDAFKNCTNGEMTVYFQISAAGYFNKEGSATLTIHQLKDLVITVHNQTRSYGSTTLDQTAYTITSGSINAGEDLKITLSTTATKTSPVGNYPITLTWDNPAYNVTSTNGTLTITAIPIMITCKAQSSVYGDTSISQTAYTITSGSVNSGDNLKITLSTTATKTSPVGDYPITLTWDNPNYNVTSTNGTLTITARPIKITCKAQTSMYGDSIALNHSAYNITSGSLVGSDSLGVKLKTDAVSSVVREYTIQLDDYTNKNYSITCVNGKYNVTKRELTIKVNDQIFKYGETFVLDQNAYTITEGEKLAGDNLNIVLTCSATSQSPVGDYPIKLTYSNSNYDIDIVEGTLSISSKSIKIQISNLTFTYGDAVSLNDLQYTILENESLPDADITFTTTATNKSKAGKHSISAKCSNSNYIVEIENGYLTIQKRPISIEISQSSNYGNAVFLNTGKYKVVQGNIVNNDSLGLLLSTTATKTSNVGIYPITTEYTNTNYDINFVKAEYEILKRPIALQVLNQSGIYGDAVVLDQEAYTIRSGLANNDDLGVVLTTDATNTSNVGSYKINITVNNNNYSPSSVSGVYTINKRAIVIQLEDQSLPYAFKLKFDKDAYRIISGRLVNEDDLGLKIYTDAKIYNLIGTFNLSAYSNNDNYEVTILEGTMEIGFSIQSFIVIFLPIFVVTGTILAIYLIRRKIKNNKFLKD